MNLDIIQKNKTLSVAVIVVLIIIVFVSAVQQDDLSNADGKLNTPSLTKILVGRWMGSEDSCNGNFPASSTRVFGFGTGTFETQGNAMTQPFITKKLIENEVPADVRTFAEKCLSKNASHWFRVELVRHTGNKVFFWAGESSSLPEIAKGSLFSDTAKTIYYRPFDLNAVEGNLKKKMRTEQ